MVKYNLTKVDWNDEYNWEMDVLEELMQHYNKHHNLHIVLNGDGMDVSKSGLARVLTLLKTLYTDEIVIHNANLLGNDTFEEFARVFKSCQHNITINKNITATFCMFAGRPTWDRLLLSAWLYHNANVIQTYHGSTKSTKNYNNNGFVSLGMDFDILCKQNINNVKLDEVIDFMKVVPLTIHNQTYTHEIVYNPRLLKQEYTNSFIEVVAETAKEGIVFFPTEKTFRPIMFNTPFITFGPVNFLSNLRKLGFKTFSKYWDETYDTVEDTNNRIVEVINVLKHISTWDLTKCRRVNAEMKEILEHNNKVLMSLTKQDLTRDRFR